MTSFSDAPKAVEGCELSPMRPQRSGGGGSAGPVSLRNGKGWTLPRKKLGSLQQPSRGLRLRSVAPRTRRRRASRERSDSLGGARAQSGRLGTGSSGRGLFEGRVLQRAPAGGPRRGRWGWEPVEAQRAHGGRWLEAPRPRGGTRRALRGWEPGVPSPLNGPGRSSDSPRCEGSALRRCRLRPSHRGAAAGRGEGGLPAGGPGKGARPGTPPPRPLRGGRRREWVQPE